MKQGKAGKQTRWEDLGKVRYYSDYVPPEDQKDFQGAVPHWLERLSNWIETLSTGAITVCAVGWMWYCMCMV